MKIMMMIVTILISGTAVDVGCGQFQIICQQGFALN